MYSRRDSTKMTCPPNSTFRFTFVLLRSHSLLFLIASDYSFLDTPLLRAGISKPPSGRFLNYSSLLMFNIRSDLVESDLLGDPFSTGGIFCSAIVFEDSIDLYYQLSIRPIRINPDLPLQESFLSIRGVRTRRRRNQ
jgi:hypothetical protein